MNGKFSVPERKMTMKTNNNFALTARRLPLLVSLSWLAMSPLLSAQTVTQEVLHLQERLETIDERFAARSEDVKKMMEEISNLKAEIKTVREHANAAKDLSESNKDRIDTIAWFGRIILGAVGFLIGVIVTQAVSNFMTSRRPRLARSAA
jgi:hypothetical protein